MLVRLDAQNFEAVIVDSSAIFVHLTSYKELNKKEIYIVCVYVHDGVDNFEDKADPSTGRQLSNRMLVQRAEFDKLSDAEDCLYCFQKDINNQINPIPEEAHKELVEDMTRDRVLDTLISINTAMTENLKISQDFLAIVEEMRSKNIKVDLSKFEKISEKPEKKARKKKEV
jgi:hypothetical protein